MIICKHMTISGRVQGVGFRYSPLAQANALGLNGWVRNLWDGRVEVLAWGPPESMAAFVDWCRQGPLHAHVTTVNEMDSQPDTTAPGFRIRH